jgi:ATP-dependent RNA helicase SUPV3L1/SUV3
VYTRMNAKGKPCSLVTGEERRMAEREDGDFGHMSACTVEMMPLNKIIDVAVIDEIQMIGNAERGWAWTQAFLGVRAKEIHLCGEERTVPLVKEICASLGEKLNIHRYERLTPLEMEDNSLNGKLRDLRKGDCVVSFSVMGIHALRQQIERATGKKVATVYGSLPPETRAQQARLFNDPDNEYDYLVASDAVGMGLNLAIKRIVFEASNKWDGFSRRTLSVADIKQIAGRAGRYKIATFKNTEDDNHNQTESLAAEDLAAAKGEEARLVGPAGDAVGSPTSEPMIKTETEEVTKGLITTLEKFDYPIVRAAMSAQPEPIRSAGIFPPGPILERFASYFPPYTPFSYILTRLHEISQMHPRFHLCGLKDQVWIADLIEHVKGLTVTDRNIICSCPASMTDKELWIKLMPAYANCVSEQTGGAIYDIEELPLEVLEADISASRGYLRELEQLHKGIVGYLWLSYRFAGVFYTRSLAFHVKSLVEAKIEEVLSKFSFTEANRRKLAAMREKQLMQEMDEAAKAEEERQGAVDSEAEGLQGDEDGGDGSQRSAELELREQTSLTSGGDHFGGEEDIGFDEPMEDEDIDNQAPKVTSLAQWRERETKSLNESRDAETPAHFSKIVSQAENEALRGSGNYEIHVNYEEPPLIKDATPEATELNPSAAEEDRAFSPEQDPSDIKTTIRLETKLERPPLETQRAPPSLEPRMSEEGLVTTPDQDEPNQKPAGFSQSGAGVPPKHLAHLDVNAKQAERDWAARP